MSAPAYMLHSHHTVMPYDAVMERFEEYVETYRHFSFFWMPTDASAELYLLKNARADDCVVKLYREANAEMQTQSLPPNEHIGRPYQIYPMVYDPNFHEMEYFLPMEHARDIITEMRRLMRRWLPLSIYPLEVRMVAADEAWMSPNYKRTNLVISISGQPGTGYWPYLRACDSLFAEFGGPAALGQIALHDRRPARQALPALRRFCEHAPALRSPRHLFEQLHPAAVHLEFVPFNMIRMTHNKPRLGTTARVSMGIHRRPQRRHIPGRDGPPPR